MNDIPDNRIDHNKHSFCSQKPKWCGSRHIASRRLRQSAATNFTDTKIYAIPYVSIWAV